MLRIRERFTRTTAILVAVVVFLSGVQVAAAQEQDPPKDPPPPRQQLQTNIIQLLMQLRQLGGNKKPKAEKDPARMKRPDGRLGVRMEVPGEAVVDQLDLPLGVGLVIHEVVPESPAAKAGLKGNDILLELDSKPVPSNTREFVKEVNAAKANTPMEAVVLRRGKRETVKGLSLPETGAQAAPTTPSSGNGNDNAQPQVPRIQVPGVLPIPGLLPGMPAVPNRRLPAVPLPLPLP